MQDLIVFTNVREHPVFNRFLNSCEPAQLKRRPLRFQEIAKREAKRQP